MTKKEFQEKFGSEDMKVTSNYATKSLSRNYNIADAVVEFCDNAYDARVDGKSIDVQINIDGMNNTLSVIDNGCGINDDSNLITLGGTDKEHCNNKIGKYGVGVSGASSYIAMECFHDANELVDVKFVSRHNGRGFEKHIGFERNGRQVNGKTSYFDVDDVSNSGTDVVFSNVALSPSDSIDIQKRLEKVFEETMKKGLNITMCVNGNSRVLGQSIKPTFVGDEVIKHVNVGSFDIWLKYRIIGGEGKDARCFEDSGIRFYDKTSGRLLAQDNKYWSWFAGREAQQTICGLRIAVYIDSSLECYNTFGIVSAKNGIAYKQYYKQAIFKDLANELGMIYRQACNSCKKINDKEIVLGGNKYLYSNGKMDSVYKEISDMRVVFLKPKSKLSMNEYASLVAENIKLKKCLSKKSAKKADKSEELCA